MSDDVGLGTLLRLLVARLDDDVQATYDELGVDFRPRFYPIVARLHRDGPTAVTRLAKAARVSQPAITQTLSALIKRGLAETGPGSDRRESIARLTPTGAALAKELAPVWGAIDRAGNRLEPGLFETLARALAALDRQSFAARVSEELQHA
jgi:MarR family transcriptional regulator, organic hydroperoxide resistance regulator